MTLYILTEIPTTNTTCLYKLGYFNDSKTLLYSLSSAKWVPITSKDLKDYLTIESKIIESCNIDDIIEMLTMNFSTNEYYTSIVQYLRGE